MIDFFRIIWIITHGGRVCELRDAVEALTRGRVPRLSRRANQRRRMIRLIAFDHVAQIQRIRLLECLEWALVRAGIKTEYVRVKSFLLVAISVASYSRAQRLIL